MKVLSQRSKYILNISLIIYLIFIYHIPPVYTSVPSEYNSLQQQMEYAAQIDSINQNLPIEYQKKIYKKILKEYEKIWARISMDDKLQNCIHKALQTTKEKESLWTKATFLVSDQEKNRILSEIIKEVIDCFEPHYESFTSELSINIERVINENIKESQNELFERKTNLNHGLPGGNGLLRESLKDSKIKFENYCKDEIVKNIEESKDMDISIGDFSTAISGAIIKLVMSGIRKALLKKGAGVAGKKILVAIPVVGWVIAAGTTALDAYSISSDIFHIPERIEDEISKALKKSYTIETPKCFGEECGNVYLKQINQFIKFTKNFDTILFQLKACPTYINLCSGIDNDEQNNFAAKLYRVTTITNNDICWIAETLGATIKNINEGDLYCLSELLNCTDPGNINKWFSINKGEICYLLRSVPKSFICSLEPSIESLSIINRLKNLNQRARDVAGQLDPKKVHWVLTTLNSFQSNQILSSSNNIRHIENTIDLISRLNPRILEKEFFRLINDYSIVQDLLAKSIPNDYKEQKILIDRKIIGTGNIFEKIRYHINEFTEKVLIYKYLIIIAILLLIFLKISRRTKIIKEVVFQNGEHQNTKVNSDNE